MFDTIWTSNIDQIVAYLNGLPAKVVRPALVDALNWAAYGIRTAEQDEMRSVFDAPTPYTLNSIAVEPASLSNPVAGVGWKEGGINKGRAAGRYLIPQAKGGPRPQTPFEYRLARAGKISGTEFLVPARGAERNGRGNLNPGQLTKILSDLGSIEVARPFPGARNAGKRRGETYIIDRTGRAPQGIYLMRGIQMILVFVITRQPTYRPIFDFDGVARRYEKANFAEKYARALDRRLTGPLKRR